MAYYIESEPFVKRQPALLTQQSAFPPMLLFSVLLISPFSVISGCEIPDLFPAIDVLRPCSCLWLNHKILIPYPLVSACVYGKFFIPLWDKFLPHLPLV